MKMMVLRAASRMKSRKGLLALKIFLFIGKERPEMVTAVAAEASLPSSFTCRPREKMGLKYKHYAAWRGLTLLLYRKQGPASLQSTRLLRSEHCRFRAIIFPLIFVFIKQEEDTLAQNKAHLKEGFVESLRHVQVCAALCNDT